MNLIKTHSPAVVDRYSSIMDQKRRRLIKDVFNLRSGPLGPDRSQHMWDRRLDSARNNLYHLKVVQCETILKAEKARDDPRPDFVSRMEKQLRIRYEDPMHPRAVSAGLNSNQINWAMDMVQGQNLRIFRDDFFYATRYRLREQRQPNVREDGLIEAPRK